MKTFKITYSDNWKYNNHGYFNADSHTDAISKIDINVKRINNGRFREIETTGKFYFVEDISKGGKTFIFE